MRHLTRDLRLIFFSTLFWGFGISLYLYIQPLYVAYLGASPEQIGLTLGTGSLLGLLLFIPAAQRADQMGRKRIMVAGWALGTAATAAMAISPNWRWFIPALAIYQLSSAAMPAFLGYVATGSRNANPNQAFTSVWIGGNLGSIFAPAIGGWIGETFGLRALYAAATVSFAISTAVISLVKDQPVVKKELRIHPKQLLAIRPFMRQMLFVFLIFFAIDVGQVMVPNYLQDTRGLSLAQIGQLGTLGSLGVAILLLTLGKFAPERRMPLLLTQFLVLMALILWLVAHNPLLIAMAYFIHGRNRLAQPFLDGRLSRMLSQHELNLGYSFRETAMRLGLTASPFVAGILFARLPALPLFAGIISLVCTLLLTFRLPTKLERLHAQEAVVANEGA